MIKENNASLGRKIEESFSVPSDFRVIGDIDLYKSLRNSNAPQTWRLLVNRDRYLYIFPALPNQEKNLSVPVLKVYESSRGDQLTILSPRAKK